ncbi:MAG: glycosyltransferase family 4 protein [Ignavibacteria bacterium]|nr:glycosyltransferase family 4 protein [Ignavibacteria bacterium]
MKKIVLAGRFSSSDKSNGMTRFSFEFVNALISNNYSVTILDYFRETEKYSYFTKLFGYEEIETGYPIRYLKVGIVRQLFFLLKEKIRFIHIITYEPNHIFLFIYKSILKFKIAVTLHAILNLEEKYEFKGLTITRIKTQILDKCYYNYSDFPIYLSKIQIEKISKIYKNSIDKILIPHGYSGDYVNHKQIDVDKLKVFYAGGTRGIKGFSIINEISQKLSSDIEFIVCGFNYPNSKNSPINKNIKYLGHLNFKEYINELQKTDVVLITSEFETFGFTLIDALKNGVVPICSKNVGSLELFQPDTIFSIVESENANEWIKEINRIYEMKKKGELNGLIDKLKSCSDKINSWEKIIELYKEKVYDKI